MTISRSLFAALGLGVLAGSIGLANGANADTESNYDLALITAGVRNDTTLTTTALIIAKPTLSPGVPAGVAHETVLTFTTENLEPTAIQIDPGFTCSTGENAITCTDDDGQFAAGALVRAVIEYQIVNPRDEFTYYASAVAGGENVDISPDRNGNGFAADRRDKPAWEGVIFNDENEDGIRQHHEAPAAGVPVTLTKAAGPPIPLTTVTTDDEGRYHFDYVGGYDNDYLGKYAQGGYYRVLVEAPEGLRFTSKDVSDNHRDRRDSDINVVAAGEQLANYSDGVHCVSGTPTLDPNRTDGAELGEAPEQDCGFTVDAGLVPVKTGNVVVELWDDRDRDGRRDAREQPVANHPVTLTNDEGSVTLNTDSNGMIVLDSVDEHPGLYATFAVAPRDGYRFTRTNRCAESADSDVSADGTVTVERVFTPDDRNDDGSYTKHIGAGFVANRH